MSKFGHDNANMEKSNRGRKVLKYGLYWREHAQPLNIELYMIAKGGEWDKKSGGKAGKGNFFHYKEAIRLIWPEIKQHRWLDLFLKEWLDHKYIGVMGPKNSGKSACAAIFHLVDYYAFPTCTTILVCSTTKERLEDRIWGDVKKHHRLAQSRFRWLPGHLIEGRQRLVTDDRDQAGEGRDMRNGWIAVPCKKGNQFVGVGDFQGIKNKRVRLLGDELGALPKTFIDAIATLDQQGDTKVTGMGNPAQTTDALGILCEPHVSLGGWEGGIDQTPKTKSWRTRFERGICIQFPGSDSPNTDADPKDPVPFPFLITRKQMEDDLKTWGKDDWHYTMFNEGRMPRGQGSRRVITRQLCLKHRAMEEALWKNSNRTRITALDAAYRAVGGDRCVFIELAFGEEAETDAGEMIVSPIIDQSMPNKDKRQIIALVDVQIIPIQSSDFDSPEDQIVMFVKREHERRGIPPENHFFDAGMRTSLVTSYSRNYSPMVNSIDFGGKPTERQVSADIEVSCRDYYSKFVTELWYSVRLIVEAQQFRGMTEDVMAEGCLREWKTVAGNKIEVETKEEMKLKTGRSPDLFDALVCGVEGARQRGFSIRRLKNKTAIEVDHKWKDEIRDLARSFWKTGSLNHTA